jgi:hypothetical protein
MQFRLAFIVVAGIGKPGRELTISLPPRGRSISHDLADGIASSRMTIDGYIPTLACSPFSNTRPDDCMAAALKVFQPLVELFGTMPSQNYAPSSAHPHLLPHDGVVARHLGDRGTLWQQIELVSRASLELATVLGHVRADGGDGGFRNARRAAGQQARRDREDGETQRPASGVDVIGLLRGFEAFGEAAGTLAGAPGCKQKQEDSDRNGAVAQGWPQVR